jgi:hypothetical protein
VEVGLGFFLPGLLLASFFFLAANALEGSIPCSSLAMGMNFGVMLHLGASFLPSPWYPSLYKIKKITLANHIACE